eukprot:XP_001697934.1 predicted protein [Chlamydomonas reinhardtii]
MQKEERDALQVAMVSYDNSYKLQEEAPAVTAAIILHFDTGRITGAPAPLPSRLTAQHEGRFAREELGLYRENQALLAEMAGGNAAAGGQQVAIMAQRQAVRAQEVQTQQLQRDKERPARRYDQDKEMTRTYVRRPVVDAVAGAGGRGGRGESRLYRLDIELGRLEFGVHPAMSQEDLLAARLMALFREYKKREAVGLVLFYAGRLAALEDSLLGAREKLFALQATEAAADDVLDAYALLGKIEREVAELRQLKEEEEALLTRTVRAMERQFEALRGIRQQQGYALTNLELTVLTRPPLEMSWKQGVLTRERLDVLLNRPSADPEDPVLKALEDQVALLGRAPRRVAMMAEDSLELQRRATEMVHGLMPAPGQQQQQLGPGQQLPGAGPQGQHMGGPMGNQPKTVGKQGSKGRYYVKLFVNHKFVDQSDVATLAENFSGDFKDLFSVQVSHFPESILVQLYERHALRDYFVAQRVAAGASLEERVVPKAMTTYDNPLADRGREEGPLGTWAGQPGSGVVGAPDIESGRSLMPPLPSVPVDRMLRRAAERIGGKANRAQIMRWLADNVIDPNDPRNAPLLELLKTHEAASGALGDLFRLDIFPDVAMKAGIYRAPDKNLLKGARLTNAIKEREERIRAFAIRFKLELGAIAQLLAPRRPLKRSKKLVKSLMTSVPRETQLMVTIQRAASLPARMARSAVRFRSLSQRTIAVPGEFPIFNEEQAGPEDGSALEPSPSALQENSDLITFNVFDEIIVEPSEPITLRRRDAEISDPVRLPERERRFLGCVRVPLSAVYQMQVLEGTFKLEAPPVVLGYVQTSQRPSTVSIYMTLRPRLAAPAGEMDERITSGEQEQVNRHAQRWRAALLGRAECRSRVIKVMAVDADGAAVLVCRYVAPTLLPPSLAVNVPYMEDSGLHKRRNDIWTSSSELLHLAGGDFEEHAHLLAGYFLQLGLQAFVVAGTSLCGARSIVVSVKDPTGEMREVGQLYDGSNIWANTQPTGRPWEMNWNLTSGRDWTTPLYEELEKQFYEELEGRVEKKVEEALSQARAAGAFVTKPDNRVSRLLKNLLREMPKTSEAIAAASLAASAALAEAAGKGPLEAPQHLGERHNLITGLQASHNERIRRESKAEAVHGHVLALPFSDSYLEAVADAVLNTGIHRIADERVKFSTAVFVEPLGASFVCCVWIYVAAIRS